jgi:hypothetical protein
MASENSFVRNTSTFSLRKEMISWSNNEENENNEINWKKEAENDFEVSHAITSVHFHCALTFLGLFD